MIDMRHGQHSHSISKERSDMPTAGVVPCIQDTVRLEHLRACVGMTAGCKTVHAVRATFRPEGTVQLPLRGFSQAAPSAASGAGGIPCLAYNQLIEIATGMQVVCKGHPQ